MFCYVFMCKLREYPKILILVLYKFCTFEPNRTLCHTYPSSPPPAPDAAKLTEDASAAPAADCPGPIDLAIESVSSMSVRRCDGLSHLKEGMKSSNIQLKNECS